MFEKTRLAHLLNVWMQRYTEHPEEFEHQWQTIEKFLSEKAAGKEPSYGELSIAYLAELDAELAAAPAVQVAPVNPPR